MPQTCFEPLYFCQGFFKRRLDEDLQWSEHVGHYKKSFLYFLPRLIYFDVPGLPVLFIVVENCFNQNNNLKPGEKKDVSFYASHIRIWKITQLDLHQICKSRRFPFLLFDGGMFTVGVLSIQGVINPFLLSPPWWRLCEVETSQRFTPFICPTKQRLLI